MGSIPPLRGIRMAVSGFLAVTLLLAACTSATGRDGTTASPPPTSSEGASPSPSATSGPAARGYAMMADLPGEPGVVLLGGADVPGPPNLPDMWTGRPEVEGRLMGGKLEPAACKPLASGPAYPLQGARTSLSTSSRRAKRSPSGREEP